MKLGDTYAYIDRIEDDQPVRLLALVVRVDNPGVGLELPQLTCLVIPPADDAIHAGTLFQTNGGLWAFGSNYAGTFEPVEAP